ncbi:MAG: chain length determinant protein tyrosine kinase EpsG [Methylomonas sp.]|jgi:chain length determinant protein tyrosine kinase EpsG
MLTALESVTAFQPDSALPVDKMLGILLIEAGLLKQTDIVTIQLCQKERNLRFGEAAVALGLVKETDIIRMLSSQFEYSYLPVSDRSLSAELIAAYQPFTASVETLRNLRTQIKLRIADTTSKILTVVGVNPGEGCSYLTANLATVFSQLSERTLLIDANLRAPRQHQVFNLTQRQGLADLLAGRCGLEVITKIPALKDLSVLPAGTPPPNPQELLTRPAFGVLLHELSSSYEVILIDTPAAMLYADAQIVCAKTGVALLIALKNHTRSNDIFTLSKELQNNRVNCLGVVLNGK